MLEPLVMLLQLKHLILIEKVQITANGALGSDCLKVYIETNYTV